MVLYHASGRVVIAHENYLEQEALRLAKLDNYTNQSEHCKHLRADVENPDEKSQVNIVVGEQEFRTLYSYRLEDDQRDYAPSQFTNKQPITLPTGVDKATFRKCSTLADDVFRYEPDVLEVKAPVTYPRSHKANIYYEGESMAYIRGEEIEKYIIPWLQKMERFVRNKKKPNKDRKEVRQSDLPRITPPTDLLECIHLYNAMLQLGLPRFVQHGVIDALVLQMYRTRLSACHLETLELTVGRFYGQGIAILDPVINHFIGTYAFRSVADRSEGKKNAVPVERRTPPPEPTPEPVQVQGKSKGRKKGSKKGSTKGPKKGPKKEPSSKEKAAPPVDIESPYRNLKRKFLEYSTTNGNREAFKYDTIIVPPELPVLGHCIRHWSGIRSNGSTAAAHTGYPLNVGQYKKFYRRDAGDPIGGPTYNTGFKDNYIKYSTYRLNRDAVTHYAREPAGGRPSPPPDEPESEREEPPRDPPSPPPDSPDSLSPDITP